MKKMQKKLSRTEIKLWRKFFTMKCFKKLLNFHNLKSKNHILKKHSAFPFLIISAERNFYSGGREMGLRVVFGVYLLSFVFEVKKLLSLD
jgi:hypothetical protein